MADPFRLQDLCLLVVINELEKYPNNLIASLPCWLRCRILRNLPILDLCLLENTAVGLGVDTGEIWRNRWPPCSSRGLRSQFLDSEHWLECSYFELPFTLREHANVRSARELRGLDSRLELALQNLPRSPRYGKYVEDHRTEYLTLLAQATLYNKAVDKMEANPIKPVSIMKAVTRELVSIKGDLLLQDWTKSFHIPYLDLPTYTKRGLCVHKKSNEYLFWEKQNIPLSKNIGMDVEFTPRRSQVIRDRVDRNEVISLLTEKLHFEVPTLHLDMNLLKSQSDCHSLYLLKYLLRDVIILGLNDSSKWSHRGLPMQHMASKIMQMCIGSGTGCHLGALSCDLDCIDIFDLSPFLFAQPCGHKQPFNDKRYAHFSKPHYSGLRIFQCRGIEQRFQLQPLASLLEQQTSLTFVRLNIFSRNVTDRSYPETVLFFSTLASIFEKPHFQVLCLDVYEVDPACLDTLFRGFLTAPCSGCQDLLLCGYKSRLYPLIEELKIRTVSKPVPDCGLQHKRLQFIDNTHFTTLLQFPAVRLNRLVFNCEVDNQKGNFPFIHLAALHPNLLVSALSFQFDKQYSNRFLQTIKDDFKSLFSMPTLQEISIIGGWEKFQEIRQALILGLNQQSEVKSLTKISLGGIAGNFEKEEYLQLWNALFTLPQFTEMEVTAMGSFCNNLRIYAGSILDNWKRLLPRQRMKLINARSPRKVDRADFDFLSEIFETCSININ